MAPGRVQQEADPGPIAGRLPEERARAAVGAGTKRGLAWAEFHRRARKLPPMAPGELDERLRDATPATDDDVPWTFRERTPVEPAAER